MRIMQPGRDFVDDQLLEGENVILFTGQEAWSDLKKFTKIIKKLQGELYIVDPYYGNATLSILEKFGKHKKIKFLTAELGSTEQKNLQSFSNNLTRFKREFSNVEIRVINNKRELHDRYIIATNGIVVIGHGLKDFGIDKESFLIFLPKEISGKIIPILKNRFTSRWGKSTKI